MAESLIEIRGVNKVFDLGKLQVHALRDMELDIFQGEYLSIMGPSGSGKSTLFNMIGAVSWVGLLTLAGYFFGNLPWVQKNLSVVIVGIIAISLVPVVIGWWQQRKV